jgi:hypothetical protein
VTMGTMSTRRAFDSGELAPLRLYDVLVLALKHTRAFSVRIPQRGMSEGLTCTCERGILEL